MNANIKRFCFQFLYTIFISYIFIKGITFQKYLQNFASKNYNILPFSISIVIIPIIVGILIAIPELINTYKQNGIWTYDWVKFLSIGIPTFYITILPFIRLVLNVNWVENSIYYNSGLSVQMVSGLIFGYVLIRCINKVEEPAS